MEMSYSRITSQTAAVARGPITFDPWGGILQGPGGATEVQYFCRKLLFALMKEASLLSEATLLEIGYPEGTRQPARPDHALRMGIMRVRAALDRVGVGGHALRNHHGVGYELTLEGQGHLMTFSGARAIQLEALLASHPDQAAVASVTGKSLNVGEC